MNEEMLKKLLEMPIAKEADVEKILKDMGADGHKDMVMAMLRILEAMKDKMPEDGRAKLMQMLADMSGYGMPQPVAMMQEKEKDMYLPVKKTDGSFDTSGVPEALRSSVEALWKQNEEAIKKAEDAEKKTLEVEGVLKAERDEKIKKEFISKAETELKGLPMAANEFGLVLKTLSEKAPEEFKALEGVLKSAAALILKGGLTETGSAQVPAAGGDAYGKIEHGAKALLAKGDFQGTLEGAITHFITKTAEGQKLYDEYKQGGNSK